MSLETVSDEIVSPSFFNVLYVADVNELAPLLVIPEDITTSQSFGSEIPCISKFATPPSTEHVIFIA